MRRHRVLSERACERKQMAKHEQLWAEVLCARLCRELEEELGRFCLAGLDLDQGQRERMEQTL